MSNSSSEPPEDGEQQIPPLPIELPKQRDGVSERRPDNPDQDERGSSR